MELRIVGSNPISHPKERILSQSWVFLFWIGRDLVSASGPEGKPTCRPIVATELVHASVFEITFTDSGIVIDDYKLVENLN